MKVFWMYEMGDAPGVFQGCTGPAAESITRQVATEPGDGEPFCVLATTPEEMWDRFIAHYSKQKGHVDKDGNSTLVNFIGGVEVFRKLFLEAQK